LCALALVACLAVVPAAHADGWIGYMNVFKNNGGSQGGFVFGSDWGVGDLKTTVNPSNPGTIIGDNLTLEPNYNTYADNPGDACWRDNGGAGPGGNKWMEANTILEVNPIGVLEYSLTGTVDANTLDSAYTAEAFIKVLDPGQGFATVLNDRQTLPASGTFAITSDLTSFQGLLLQTGFTVSGPQRRRRNPRQRDRHGHAARARAKHDRPCRCRCDWQPWHPSHSPPPQGWHARCDHRRLARSGFGPVACVICDRTTR
jgi:hypothetical protein